MKDSNSVEKLKLEMSKYLNLHPENSDWNFEDYFLTASKIDKHVESLFKLEFFEPVASIADLNFVDDLKATAAQKTVESLSYTYNGGEQWRPPLGQPPAYIIDENKEISHERRINSALLTLCSLGYEYTGDMTWHLDNKTLRTPSLLNKHIIDWLDANEILETYDARETAKDAFKYALSLLDNKPTPNIIFGILDNGEIFVEVNGIQHTPDESFYKMSTLQASKLAHQVRDLELDLLETKEKNKMLYRLVTKLKDEKKALKTNYKDVNENLTDTMLTLGNIKHQIKISKVGD